MIKKITFSIIVLACMYVAYYLISPLFITKTINEPVGISVQATSSAMMQKTDVITSHPLIGTSYHPVEGTVRLINTSEGQVIRYENFKTINGPDLFVYVSTDLQATDFINLGALKATEGNINYAVPRGIDLGKYKYVLVWCKQFGVLFNSADISKSIISATELLKKDITQPTITDEPQGVGIEKTALLATGCFWCVEHDLEKVTGVVDVVSGYAGGKTDNPTYENYSAGGHREVVLVKYDSSLVTYANLVEHIIKHGDSSDAGGSFYDRGLSYAPALYYANEKEKSEAQRVVSFIDGLKVFEKPLPIVIIPRVPFWPAEEYHQDYAVKNPIRYAYYRSGSGRDAYIEKTWGASASIFSVPKASTDKVLENITSFNSMSWKSFVKPSSEVLKSKLTPLQYEVTQKEGTESPFNNIYDKNNEAGIYVDIVSGEPLYFSKDKFDSGTGWPSFVRPISSDVVTLTIDKKLFSSRTEVRSRYADSHLGHVFDDGPSDRGGKRYCMNSASLRFISKSDMEKEGYGYLLSEV